MDMAIGIALLVVFLAVVALIVRGQSPVVMLLVLALA
jgi:Gnt-I system high-affinity gluconate transporter